MQLYIDVGVAEPLVQYYQDAKVTKDEEVGKSTAESHCEGSAGGK